MNKPTVVLGASPDPLRYSYKAVCQLIAAGHTVYPVGITQGSIANTIILPSLSEVPSNIDTITIYLSPKHQEALYEAILALMPRRIIFNPGAENAPFEILAQKNNIHTENACTLVLLSTNQY